MSRFGKVIRHTASLTFIPFLTQKLNEKKYKEHQDADNTSTIDQFYFYEDVVVVPGSEEDEDTQKFWKDTIAMRQGIEKKSNETITNISRIKEEIYNMRTQTEAMYESCQCFVSAVDRTSFVLSEDYYLQAY